MAIEENVRAVLRADDVRASPELDLPWNQEGEFEIFAVVMGQSQGELLVRLVGSTQNYLTICGFLPGKVTGQLWRLECLRESGRIELLDGEPLPPGRQG